MLCYCLSYWLVASLVKVSGVAVGDISLLCYCLSHWLVASLVKFSGVAVGGDILAVLLSLSLVGCFFSEGLRCDSRGRYPCCAIVSLTCWLLL